MTSDDRHRRTVLTVPAGTVPALSHKGERAGHSYLGTVEELEINSSELSDLSETAAGCATAPGPPSAAARLLAAVGSVGSVGSAARTGRCCGCGDGRWECGEVLAQPLGSIVPGEPRDLSERPGGPSGLGSYARPGVGVGADACAVGVCCGHWGTSRGYVLVGDSVRLPGPASRYGGDRRSAATASAGGARSATDEAADWLLDFLVAHGRTAESAKVKEAGKDAGHKEATLKRASSRLGVESESVGFPRRTWWTLPERPVGSQSAQVGQGRHTDDPTERNTQSAQFAQPHGDEPTGDPTDEQTGGQVVVVDR